MPLEKYSYSYSYSKKEEVVDDEELVLLFVERI